MSFLAAPATICLDTSLLQLWAIGFTKGPASSLEPYGLPASREAEGRREDQARAGSILTCSIPSTPERFLSILFQARTAQGHSFLGAEGRIHLSKPLVIFSAGARILPSVLFPVYTKGQMREAPSFRAPHKAQTLIL